MQIQIQHITKEYAVGHERVSALRGVSCSIQKGEKIAIVGRSGSGKSTLLQLIGGLDTPTSGSIIVNKNNIGEMNETQRAQYRNTTIGFVFQFFYLLPYLTLLQNVEIPLVFTGEERIKRQKSSIEALHAVGLGEMIHRLPQQLSGGQMQRVAIARAIVHKPEIILADEPTGNLDEATGEQILQLLDTINRDYGTTLIIITHDKTVATQADRIIEITDGKII